ncbi:hypothetical protein N8477_06120 [Candidatus Thioglobus sp.]|nr:hypothetical protein [Candidatus Thioglobus sp.]
MITTYNKIIQKTLHSLRNDIKKKKNRKVKEKIIFSFSSGRSGQRWLHDVFLSHSNCAGGAERLREFEAFYRYVTWNKLDIDNKGFYCHYANLIQHDLSIADISINSSPYFVFGFDEIDRIFSPDYFLYIIRDPREVVSSLISKGWYKENPIWSNNLLTIGTQPQLSKSLHHSFGRIVPRSLDEFNTWSKLTQVGKVSWYYNAINSHILSKINSNSNRSWIVKLKDIDQNYDYYRDVLCSEFGLHPVMSKSKYYSLKHGMVNKGTRENQSRNWSQKEISEFDYYTSDFIEKMNKINTSGI